jgi:hypothetical protein
MPLAPGTRLGPYEILAPLGAGGMGEVYCAKDTRLDRSVAVKVLPAHLTSDPTRRARFEREAKAVSSLNHSHICTLYDVGRDRDTDYLVMELLEGKTLAERLRKGPLPLDQMLRAAIEIADALDNAHRQGVIHRDLKPGNVMLTKAGSKLMDFGLAKRTLQTEAGEPLSALPTASSPLTGEGTLLGTISYMSPEQLEGKEADARSDLWALGCVVYELATGKRAFEGKSQASLISAIMTAEPPPITQLQPLTPPALERLVKVCLSKDPDERLQTAHDVMQELKWIAEAPGGVAALDQGRGRRPRWTRRELLGWGLFVAAAVGGLAVHWARIGRRSPEAVGQPTYATIPLTSAPIGRLFTFPSFAVSPDGQLLALSQDQQLVVRPLRGFSMTPLEGTRRCCVSGLLTGRQRTRLRLGNPDQEGRCLGRACRGRNPRLAGPRAGVGRGQLVVLQRRRWHGRRLARSGHGRRGTGRDTVGGRSGRQRSHAPPAPPGGSGRALHRSRTERRIRRRTGRRPDPGLSGTQDPGRARHVWPLPPHRPSLVRDDRGNDLRRAV